MRIKTTEFIYIHSRHEFLGFSRKMSARRSARLRGEPDTEGLKAAQEVAHEAEQKLGVKHLDPIIGDEEPPQKATNKEDYVWVFAFGSNMSSAVLSGRRMIKPVESVAAILPGYRLSFNQPGLPYREPGFATVEPLSQDDPELYVHGVAHLMRTSEWNYYISVKVNSYDGRVLEAFTLQTQPKTIERLKGRNALPSKRYLNLLRKGAEESGLSPDYQRYLQRIRHYEPHGFGGYLGAIITSIIAYGTLFPFFTLMRTYRKIRGLHSVKPGGALARFQSAYFHFVFALAWGLHDLLRPVLGCGCTEKPKF
jgi:hypothetical protein